MKKLLIALALLGMGCSKSQSKYGGCEGPPKMVNGAIDCLGAGQSVEVSVNLSTGENKIVQQEWTAQ